MMCSWVLVIGIVLTVRNSVHINHEIFVFAVAIWWWACSYTVQKNQMYVF